MHRSLIVVASAAALLAACGQRAENAANAVANALPDVNVTAENAPTTPSGPSAGGPATAPNFVEQMAESDMFETAAAKIAQARSSSKEVKDFAATMIADHAKSTAALKQAITESSLDIMPPTELPAELKSKLDALNAASGADFDRLYMEQQVDAHDMAVSQLNGYAKGGDTPAFKTFAEMTAPVVQMHLDRARMIRDAMK